MTEIKKLFGINNIELDPVNGKLFIEETKNEGIKIDITQEEVMHLLAEFTDVDIEQGKDVYGIKGEGQ